MGDIYWLIKRLYKNCVQFVETTGQNTVRTFPSSPQLVAGQNIFASLVPHFFTNPHNRTHGLSQFIHRIKTGISSIHSYLSALSPWLTTTTTKYLYKRIMNKGAVQ